LFVDNDARLPFERAETFGFRCIRYLRPVPDNLMAPVNRRMRDYSIEKPVSEEHFKFYQSLYAYDRTPLEEKLEGINETDPNWRVETITFNAAYGNERVIAYLFVPPKAKPPYQTVVRFPGGYALFMDKLDSVSLHGIRHFIQGGRAVLYPVYKGTYQRKAKLPASSTMAWRDLVVQMCKDLARSVDYLETRTDIDRSKIAYHGISLGSITAVPCLGVEPRLKTAILQGEG
jgi:cephalosporin-C deacetylase-like acetyl esterase